MAVRSLVRTLYMLIKSSTSVSGSFDFDTLQVLAVTVLHGKKMLLV